MAINIKNFKKIFPFQFNYSESNKGLLIGDRIQNDANLRSSILSNIIKSKNKYNVYLVSDLNDKKNIPVFKYLNIKKFSINFKIKDMKYFWIFIKSFFDCLIFYLKTFFVEDKISWLIKKFHCKGVRTGDLIYDLYIRYDFKFLNPTIYEIKFFQCLITCILKTNFIDYLVKKYKIKVLVSTQMSFSSYGNLILRYGTKHKLITFLTSYNFVQRFDRYTDTLTSPFKIKKKKILKNEKKVGNVKVKKFYTLRKNGKFYGSYVPINTIKKVYGLKEDNEIFNFKKKINKLKPSCNVNVFALHCFSDSPNINSGMIFKDYYDQFIKTINYIRRDKKNFWIIKPHPARTQYHEEGIIEKIIDRYRSDLDNVIICPEKINNLTLFNLTDNLINCASTISLEFACFGKKSIVACDAPYFHKDLFLKPKSVDQYFNLINNLNKYKTILNKKQILMAKRILYILELESNNNLKKSNILPDIVLNTVNENSYLKLLNKNIKKNNYFPIFNDPLYKSLDILIKKTVF